MKLDLDSIEKQARAKEVLGQDVTRRTIKALEVEDLEDFEAELDARKGQIEKALSREE